MPDEERLINELRDLRAALDESSIVSITDTRGVIQHVNERFCEISQFRRDELIGKSHSIVKSGHHPRPFYRQLWATICAGRTWRGEICNRARDGSFFWLSTTIVPFLDENGKPVQFIAIRTDITAQKQGEERIQANERLLGEILDSIPAEVAVLDHEANIVRVNRVWNDFTAANGGDSSGSKTGVGANYLAVCDGADSSEARQAAAGIREVLSGVSPKFEIEYPCDGPYGPRWFLLSVAPLRFDHRGAVLTHTDITARRRIEEKQRQSEEILRLLVDHAPAAVAMLDRELRYLAASRRWLDDYGLDGSVIGKGQDEVLPEIFRKLENDHRLCLEGEVRRSDDDTVEMADGSLLSLKWEMHPWRDRNGMIGGIAIFTENVSARKAIENALRESEARYRTFFDANPLPVLVYDERSLEILAVNDAAKTLYGYSEAEFIGLRVVVVEPGAKPFKPGAPARRAAHAIHRNRRGSRIEVEISDHPLTYGGRHARFATVNDVTERNRLSRRLTREMREKFGILESINEAFVTFDSDFRYVYANPAAERHVGKNLEEVLGRTLWEVFPEIVGTRFEREYRRAMEERCEVVFEEYYAPFDQWLEIKAFPWTEGLAVFYRNITDRRRSDALIREKNQLLEQTYDAIFIWNFDGGIISWNANAERLYGYTAAEAIGGKVREMLNTEYPTTFERFLVRLKRDGVWEGELVQTTRSGEQVIVESRLHVIKVDGDRDVVLETVHDVTERRRLESKLARSAKLALVGELAAGLAHELKNPLAGIKGVVDILIERRKSAPGDEHEILTSVRGEIERIDRTVRLLLRNSRPKPMEIKPAALDETVRRAAKLASYQFGKYDGENAGIVLELPENHVILAHDEAGIEDAVLNLIINAGDAIEGRQNGRITVSLKVDKKYAAIHVADNGCGIDAERIDEIFLPFKTSKSEGTGLGLAAVKRIIRAHGGECTVESEPGKGSAFTITIPLRKNA